MPNSNTINTVPPFLELSRTTLEGIDTRGLDIENVLSVWTGLTKCSSFIKNGKRLENISWRIVNRQLINSRQEEKTRKPGNGDNNTTQEKVLPLPSTSVGKSTQKLNDGDLFSLLSIVSEQTVDPQRPQLTKRKSSSKSNLFLSKKSSESLIQRPTLFRKSSSSKSLKKLNHTKKKSNLDLPSMTPAVTQISDTDLFEQPHPRYAFGIYDDKKKNDAEEDDEQKPARPALKRNDTSIIRGFSTDNPSVASPQVPDPSPPKPRSESPKKPSPAPLHTPSLFGNGTRAVVEQQRKPSHPTEPSKPASLFCQQRQASASRSRSSDRVRSPLSHETTSEVLKGKSTPSLFQKPPQSTTSPPQTQTQTQQRSQNNNSKPPPTSSLFNHSNNSGHQVPKAQQQSSGAMKSSLFEQVGISPNLRKPVTPPSQPQISLSPVEHIPQPPIYKDNEESHITHQKKRTNVLSNLGMTSLAKKEPRKDKNMFFIESSPSPTETPRFIDDAAIAHATSTSPEFETHKAPGERRQHSRRHGKRHSGSSNNTAGSSRSPPPHKSGAGPTTGNNTSLFQGKVPVREVMFSSDDSLSEESDWSSVSEDLESEDEDAKFSEQWQRSSFKRDDTVTKPQIKRSLLSGLFLSEMQTDSLSSSTGVINASNVRAATPAAVSATTNIDPVVSKANPSDGHDLSSSLSSMHIQLKQRRTSSTLNDTSAPLELNTSEPHAEISTSHVTVGGLVQEPHHDEVASLKEKLESTQESQTPLSSSFSQIAKSALHLTNYFGHQRKNSFSSIVSDRTRVRFKHESNAPPTASTLLPTALSTHMFLPNAHQRAKSRLTALVETDGGSSSSTSTREPSRKNSNTPMHSEASYEKPIKSPTVPIKNHRIKVDIGDDEKIVVEHQNTERGSNVNTISRKLSPKTTRKQMLATELSDSLRKSMLWERQYGMYPTGDNVKVVDGNGRSEQGEERNEEYLANGELNGDQVSEDQMKKKKNQKAPKVIKPEMEKNDDDEWEKESFYARGW